MSLEQKVESSLRVLKLLLKFDGYDIWEVGFSGGKDSLLLLHLITTFLKECNKKPLKKPKHISVVYVDTLVEIPILREPALKVLEDVAIYSYNELNGVIQPKILKPFVGQDFFSMMIERGYPPPHYRFRWCVPRLKINPFMKYLKEFDGKIVMISGERLDESTSRSRIMRNRRQTCGQLGALSRDDKGNIIATPLKDWTKDDVFAFLSTFNQPWNGKPYSYVLEIYGIDELRAKCACGLSPNVRYGCWVCTVIKKDKALEHLVMKGYRWAECLLKAKEDIRKIGLEERFREIKTNGKFGKLNQEGRAAVVGILINVLLEAKEGLYGYLKYPLLRKKLESWIERYRETF